MNYASNIVALRPEDRIPDVLLCPRCGSNNLHHFCVTIYERKEDADQALETRVTAQEVVTKLTAGWNNPSSRRHGLAVMFYCECCPEISELTIAQHKGETFLEWRSPCGPIPLSVE